MNNSTHDPSEYIRGFQQLLISDKKRIAFLFGAGTSLFTKKDTSKLIPAIAQLTELIEVDLNKTDKHRTALIEMREEIGPAKYNIETLLSNLIQKEQIIGKGILNGLNGVEFAKLIKDVKMLIREKVSIHNGVSIEDLIHFDFAEWLRRSDRKFPIEIFTTNYDYLFEIGLEAKNTEYYDGFTGSLAPFFNSESVEDLSFLPYQTKLWKVHGSLGWHYDEKSGKVIRKDSTDQDILIYPSTLKYNDSKKQPYTALLDRLTNFLREDDAVLITVGYSFGDDHINERIMTALGTRASSNVFAFLFDIVGAGKSKTYGLDENSILAKKAKGNSKLSIYGIRNAVIGGKFGTWKLKRESDKAGVISINLYFDEDAPIIKNEPNAEGKGDEIWTGEGELILPRFSKFVEFLNSMVIKPDNIK